MSSHRSSRVLTLALLLTALAAPAASARSAADGPIAHAAVYNIYDADQLLISATPSGEIPNGDSSQGVISRDARIGRYVAYTSEATDITSTQTGGVSNVFLVGRAGGYGRNGTQWRLGNTTQVSVGLRGTAPDGPSSAPALDGDDGAAAKCLGFVSSATNLVSGDTDGQADVFLYDFGRRALSRIPTPGIALEVGVADGCRVVVFATTTGIYVRIDGKVRRVVSRGSGITDLELSAYGNDFVYARNGTVYSFQIDGRDQYKIGAGRAPDIDGFGRYVLFESGGRVISTDNHGRKRKTVGSGTEPTQTSGGHFIFSLKRGLVYLNVKTSPVGYCPTSDSEGPVGGKRPDPGPIGEAHTPTSSLHGNYLVQSCTYDDQPDTVSMQWLGPQ